MEPLNSEAAHGPAMAHRIAVQWRTASLCNCAPHRCAMRHLSDLPLALSIVAFQHGSVAPQYCVTHSCKFNHVTLAWASLSAPVLPGITANAKCCACRQRRIAAVQAEFGLPGQTSNDSSDTNIEVLQSAQSDLAADTSVSNSPFESLEPLLEEDSADWETVPVKPKREATALPSASAPAAAPLSAASVASAGWVESPMVDDTAGQWEIPHKHTKLSNHQASSSPAAANGIKAMRDGEQLRGSMGSDSAEGSKQRRRPGGRGRGQNRGRGRGRSYSNNHRTPQDRSQQLEGEDGWSHDPSTTAQHNSPGEDEGVPSSWGADTVFPLSPLNPSLLTNAEGASSAPRVLTIPRPPQTRSMTTGNGGGQQQQQAKQQQGRGYKDSRARGSNSSNGRGGRGRQSAQADRVQSCPVYDISDQPACQQISFGSFGAEFGSTLQGTTAKPATDDGNALSSSHVYQQQQHERVPRQQSHKGVYRGRGGRGRYSGRGRSASERNNRQNATQGNAVTVA